MENKKALFIHIAKTGGSSILTAPWILVHGSPDWSPKYAVRDYNLKLAFTFVRDPYTRFSSAALNEGYATPETFEKWTVEEFAHNNNLSDFMGEWRLFIEQSRYVERFMDDVGFIGRFERLNEDWKEVCRRVEEVFPLPHLQKNKYPDHASYHTEATRAIVRDIYWKDFELFGYEQ